MKLIAPSILSADFSRIKEEIKIVEDAGADMLHLDVMDGHFVPNITFGPKMVNDINKISDLPLDVHLMITDADKYIESFVKSGADWVSVHYEASVHLNRSIDLIKKSGAKAGVVINPATPVENLKDILPYTDFVLLMSVNPGFGGQKFIENSLGKARKLKKIIDENSHNVFIEMDGGIDENNIKELSDTGVNVFVAGNSIFRSADIKSTIRKMKDLIN